MGKLVLALCTWERRLLRWQGNFVWACAHAAPGIFIRSVPHADTCFSFGSLYIFSQALGLVWMFLVVLLAVMSVRIVSAAVDSPDGTLPGYGERPLCSIALCYVFYSVLRLLILFARSMWTVAWELYHDFPTLRRMLLGASRFHEGGRPSPRGENLKRPSPKASPRGKGSKDSLNEKEGHITQARRQARRRIVLVTPLLVLALGHLTLLVGQFYCDGQGGSVSGVCSDALPIFQPTGHLNRTVRFVLFVSLIQWFQAFTGLFTNFSHAIGQGKGLVARFVSLTLLGLLMPISTWRLFMWLLQPAGSGVVRRIVGGLPHHVADTALVTAWSWWSLAAVSVVMRPQLLGLSGFTLRSVSLDSRWRNLTTLFKYTLFFWLGVHFLRGCVAHGFASAQTDLITISFVYPMLLCFVWTATFIAVSLSGIFQGPLPWLGACIALPGIYLLSQLLCSWVGRDQHVLLTTLVWLHLLRAGFRVARYVGLWLKTPVSGSPSEESTPPIEIKFAVNPDSHKVLKTTYTVERRLGRIAARVLLLICATFLVILTSCVLLAGLQQRSGLFLEDLLWWQELNEKTLEVTNAGASVMTLASRGASSSDADAFTKVLERNTTGHYAVCGHTWHSLQLVDYALLSLLAYITPSEKNDMPKLLKKLFPHLEVSIRHLPSQQHRRWLEFEVKRCQSGGLWTGWQEGGCRSLSVVSVSGTDISRIADYAENLRMWTEPVALQILQTMFPTIRIWPRDSSSMVIRTIHDILCGLGLEDNQWHYREILDYVRQIPREQEVVVTGHSLGGGIALVVGALTDRLAVALQPPGVFYSLAKHEAAQRTDRRHGALHQRSVSLVFEGDWIGNFDGHGGLVQTMLCDQSQKSIAVGCHLLEGAICHLLRHCGDEAERFDVCRHEYQPGHTMLNILRVLWRFLQMSIQSSFLQIDLQPFMVACIGASFVVVLRHGAPPMLRAALQP